MLHDGVIKRENYKKISIFRFARQRMLIFFFTKLNVGRKDLQNKMFVLYYTHGKDGYNIMTMKLEVDKNTLLYTMQEEKRIRLKVKYVR